MRPIIGITLDWQEKGTFSKRPHYALREAYFDIVYKAGGLPVALPYIDGAIDDYLKRLDGLLIPGGFFASPPNWYIEEGDSSVYEESPRLRFDLALIEKALQENMPILGICAGMQLLAGYKGCKMTSDLHKIIKTNIDHLNGAPAEEYAHKVIVEEDTLLAKITGESEFSINTAHREAVVQLAGGVIKSGVAEDGVIEAIELPDHEFALGVQWHPEFFADNENDANFKIIKALVDKAGEKC